MRFDPALRDLLSGMDEGEFLGGPGRGAGAIDVDPAFGSDWSAAKTDMAWDLRIDPERDLTGWARSLVERARSGRLPVLLEVDGLLVLPAASMDGSWEEGVVAIDPYDAEILVGLYCGVTLRVRSDRQGRGVGSRLVAARVLRDGALPAWSEEVPAYSPAGAAAHRAAFRILRDACENERNQDPEREPVTCP